MEGDFCPSRIGIFPQENDIPESCAMCEQFCCGTECNAALCGSVLVASFVLYLLAGAFIANKIAQARRKNFPWSASNVTIFVQVMAIVIMRLVRIGLKWSLGAAWQSSATKQVDLLLFVFPTGLVFFIILGVIKRWSAVFMKFEGEKNGSRTFTRINTFVRVLRPISLAGFFLSCVLVDRVPVQLWRVLAPGNAAFSAITVLVTVFPVAKTVRTTLTFSGDKSSASSGAAARIHSMAMVTAQAVVVLVLTMGFNITLGLILDICPVSIAVTMYGIVPGAVVPLVNCLTKESNSKRGSEIQGGQPPATTCQKVATDHHDPSPLPNSEPSEPTRKTAWG